MAERGIQGGGDDQAGDAAPGRLAGCQPGSSTGGVGGGHDHLGRAAALAGHGPGEQPCQDGAGCRGRAGTGQAEAAEGGDVRAGFVAVADPEQ